MEKLRNKNTGVIVKFLSLELVDEDEIEFTYELPSGHEEAWSYSSLEKFKEEWEIKIEGWTEGKAYHIEELCGEDEE